MQYMVMLFQQENTKEYKQIQVFYWETFKDD